MEDEMSTRQMRRGYFTLFSVLSIASLAIGAVSFFGHTLYPVNAVQGQERLLHRLPVEDSEPIVITDIKVNGQPVSFDQKFVGGDDWMKGLVFTIKNRSDKLILCFALGLRFPRPAGSPEPISISELSYGNDELIARLPTRAERLIGIAPGQTANVQLTLQGFNDLQQFLAATGYSSIIDRVDLKISEVIFEDDIMWLGGRYLRRDPKTPSVWDKSAKIVTKPPVYLASMMRRSAYRVMNARVPGKSQVDRFQDRFAVLSPSPYRNLVESSSRIEPEVRLHLMTADATDSSGPSPIVG